MKYNGFLAAVSGVFFLVYAFSAAAADENTPGKGSDTPSVKENPAFAGKMERTPPRRPHDMGHFRKPGPEHFRRPGPEHFRRPGPEHFRRPGPGRFPGHHFSRFTPEEQVELREFLHKKDPAGFRKKMQELREKYASAEDRKIRDLRKNYHAAKTPEEKEKLRKELRESVRLQMEKRLEFTRGQIRSAEAKLQKLKKFYRDNLAEKDEIVEKITDFLCKEEKGMLRPRRRPPFMGERAIPPEEVKNRRPEPKK